MKELFSENLFCVICLICETRARDIIQTYLGNYTYMYIYKVQVHKYYKKMH